MSENKNEKKVLCLTLKKKWFDLIKQGIKTEEYREIKPYWETRLSGRHYDIVKFRNGYQHNAPTIVYEIKEISITNGKEEWVPLKTPTISLLNWAKSCKIKEHQ